MGLSFFRNVQKKPAIKRQKEQGKNLKKSGVLIMDFVFKVTKVVSVGLFYGRPLSRVNRANLKLVQMKLAECQSKRLSSETPKELQLGT